MQNNHEEEEANGSRMAIGPIQAGGKLDHL